MKFYDLENSLHISVFNEKIVFSKKLYWSEHDFLLKNNNKDFIFNISEINRMEYNSYIGKLTLTVRNVKKELNFYTYEKMYEFIGDLKPDKYFNLKTKAIKIEDIIDPVILFFIFLLSIGLATFIILHGEWTFVEIFITTMIETSFLAFYAIFKTFTISKRIIYFKK